VSAQARLIRCRVNCPAMIITLLILAGLATVVATEPDAARMD
jgi:hypothetical protein